MKWVIYCPRPPGVIAKAVAASSAARKGKPWSPARRARTMANTLIIDAQRQNGGAR